MIIEATFAGNTQTIASAMEETDQTFDANLGTVHILDGGDSYQRGYDDGHASGYASGHGDGWNDGLIAGAEPMRKYYNGETDAVELPDGVTFLRGSAFRNHTLTSISGLDSVTTVDGYAFADCKSLTGISLPNATRLNARAFYGCTSLASVYMPKVTRILNQVFYNCTALTEVTFQSTPTSIDSTAFSGCTNLVTINVPWAEGTVAGEDTKWGATNATVNYNYTRS